MKILCKLGIHKWSKQPEPLGCVVYGIDRWCSRCMKTQLWNAEWNIWVDDND